MTEGLANSLHFIRLQALQPLFQLFRVLQWSLVCLQAFVENEEFVGVAILLVIVVWTSETTTKHLRA